MLVDVVTVDEITGQTKSLNNDKYCVFLDDVKEQIKNKIFIETSDFLNETVRFSPNLIKMEIKTDDKTILIDSSNRTLLSYYHKYPENPILYVKSIFDVIILKDKYVIDEYKQYDLEPYSLLYFSPDVIEELYNEIKKEFTDLELDDLVNVLKMKLFSTNKEVLRKNELSELTQSIQDFFNSIKNKYSNGCKVYEKDKGDNDKFCKVVKTYTSDKYYKSGLDGIPEFTYTNLTFLFNIQGIRNVKLDQIFNQFLLSERIPFIAYNESSRTNPKVKVYNLLTETLDKLTIRSWIINEQKKIGKITYKRLRGLMFKINLNINTFKSENEYATVVINRNGTINVKIVFQENDKQTSLVLLEKLAINCVDTLITNVNKYNVRFSRLGDPQLTSISAILDTDRMIDKDKFFGVLSKPVAYRIFEQKDTKDVNVISFYARTTEQIETEESERLGVTINLKDNPYKKNSSLIIIYGARDSNQLKLIVDNIFILSEIYGAFTSDIRQVIKPKESLVKQTSRLGGETSSKECQKGRQPVLYEKEYIDNKNDDSVLNYKGKKYVCKDTDEYKYPGLTTGKIPCCFKNSRNGWEMILDPLLLETVVQPSNFKVTVEKNDKQNDETFVIKVLSHYLPGFDLDKSRYFYLNNDLKSESDFPLVHIHNDKLIEQIKRDEKNNKNIWLERIPLYILLSRPNVSECKESPDLSKRFGRDLNDQCVHHTENKTFGYNNKSFPCCFKNLKVYHKQKDEKISKMYIHTTDKLLESKRQGTLPNILNVLLNEELTEQNGAFLKWGVTQNEQSFLNCIVECISVNTQFKIDNTFSLKRYLINYLDNNQDVFVKLNSGNIHMKYKSIDAYKKQIDAINGVQPYDIIDLIQIVLKCNIIILDIPFTYSQTETTFNYDKMKIICHRNIKQDKQYPFIILIKRQTNYEIIIKNKSIKWNSKTQKMEEIENVKPEIDFVFTYDKNKSTKTNIANLFVDYYESTCVKKDEFPQDYKYKPLYSADYVLNTLSKTSHKIKAQIVNSFNKVNLLLTQTDLTIPIKEIGIISDINQILLKDFINGNDIKDINYVINNLKIVNQTLKPELELVGLIVVKDQYTAALTNVGQMIPLNPTNIDQQTKINIPTLPYKYYWDIDESLIDGKIGNREHEWNTQKQNIYSIIFETKQFLGNKIVDKPQLKNKIISINTNPKLTKTEKIDKINNILENILENNYISKDNYKSIYPFVVSTISNDIINDNIENGLLNNLITEYKLTSDQIIKTDDETVWLDIKDINKWLKDTL